MWINAPYKRNGLADKPSGTIHPAMIELLEQAGEKGVRWQEFEDIAWRADFHAKRVDWAMREIARHYGYPLQYKGVRARGQHPDRYRILPGWDHRFGRRTSETDFE